MDKKLIILDPEKELYFSLDEVGSRMWFLIEQYENVTKILDILLQEYNINKETLKKDLFELISKLEKSKLVRIVN